MELGPVLTAAGVVLAALFALVGVLIAQLYGEVHDLRDDLSKERASNRVLWAWCQKVMALYYMWRRPEAPELPDLPDQD